MSQRASCMVAVMVMVAGCGTSVIDDACSVESNASCDKLDQCIKDGVAIRYGDRATCVARRMHSCVAALSAPGTGNYSALVASCGAAIKSASCEAFEASQIPECQPKTGSLAVGAACAFNSQCATSFCAITTGTNCGTCAAATVAGDSCATHDCSYQQTCVAKSQSCQTSGAVGTSCDGEHPCGYLLSCVGAGQGTSGQCVASQTTVGASCDPKRQTGPTCANNQGVFCDGQTKQCAAVAYAAAGSACGDVAGVTTLCSPAATCVGAMGMTPGTCKALAKDGEACDTVAGPSCMAPARCVTGSPTATVGTCTQPDSKTCT